MSMSGTEQLPTRLIEELDVQKREEGGEQLPNLAGDMIGQGAMPEWYISPEQRSMTYNDLTKEFQVVKPQTIVPKKASNDRAVSRNTDPCVECGGDDDDGLILLCDECNHAYHDFCAGFQEKLLGDWLCPSCKKH